MHAAFNLCSGGLDSYLMWWLFTRHAANVYVRIGHAYQSRELGCVALLMEHDPGFRCSVIDGPAIGAYETETGIIPVRNLLLLATVAARAAYSDAATVDLYLGALADEINSDKSEAFCDQAAAVLNTSCQRQYWTRGTTFSVTSPVRAYTKAQLLRRYIDAGGDPAPLRRTRSCYGTTDYDERRHCGRCPACFKRWVAFRAANVPDPTSYAQPPEQWRGVAPIVAAARAGTYGPQRTAETLQALGLSR